ncbi:MAG: MBL fold metallo-hydrolase [Defluviitaleaceae bacterium]|nr:MBL fold metallo-hydrolase [Defluviitaleaceae bacterium]
MKIAENTEVLFITRDGFSGFHLVLTWDEKNLVLIDACLPGMADDIVKAIANAGFKAEDLTHLIITHQDWDHVGSIRELVKIAPKIKVVAHEAEAPYIDGRELPIKLVKRLEQFDSLSPEMQTAVTQYKEMYESTPVTVHEEVTDKQVLPVCGGLEIVHTPGHTPGHIAVYLQKSRVIVVGDAANVENGQIVGFNPIHIHDPELAGISVEKIKGYDLNGVVAYHTGYLQL